MGGTSGWKTVTNVLSKTILQPWLAKGPKLMRVRGKEGMTWPNIVAEASAETDARVALAMQLFRTSIGYRDADSEGTWVEVGNGGTARQVEVTGARVGDTCVLMRKGLGGSRS